MVEEHDAVDSANDLKPECVLPTGDWLLGFFLGRDHLEVLDSLKVEEFVVEAVFWRSNTESSDMMRGSCRRLQQITKSMADSVYNLPSYDIDEESVLGEFTTSLGFWMTSSLFNAIH
jgi:hypothetical protein